MRFSRIRLENWRNFRDVNVALQRRAFLVGPNASGKSNFLNAFRFLRDLASAGGGFEKSVEQRGGVTLLRNLGARRSPDITIEAWLELEETWRYQITFNQDHQSHPILKSEKVWRNDILLLDRPDQDDKEDEERLRQTHLEQTIANKDFRDIYKFFESVRYFHLVPQLVRDPERSAGKRADPFGSDLLEQIATTNKRQREKRLRLIQKALKTAMPQLSELKLEKDKRGIPHLVGRYEHWRPQGALQTEADFSDGTLRLLGLLWSLLSDGGPLLLEEPELSLHPGVVRHIPQMMWRAQRSNGDRQVLLSTHSSDLLQDEGIAPDEVLLFIPNQDMVEVTDVSICAEINQALPLLDAGLTMAEVALPLTEPQNAYQLSLFQD